jgi:LAO/AO transport system kinase
MGDLRDGEALDRLAAQVVDGSLDPYAAADRLVDAVTV